MKVIKIRNIIVCSEDAPVTIILRSEERVEQFIQQEQITRDQIISMAASQGNYQGCFSYVVSIMYEQEDK